MALSRRLLLLYCVLWVGALPLLALSMPACAHQAATTVNAPCHQADADLHLLQCDDCQYCQLLSAQSLPATPLPQAQRCAVVEFCPVALRFSLFEPDQPHPPPLANS